MKHIQFFEDFLKEEVNLNQSRLDRLNTSVAAVTEYLTKNLAGYEKVERQGSHALRTIIKPIDESREYDADGLLYMEYCNTNEPKDYINEVYSCLRENDVYAEKARRKTRCVVLDYAGDFHLDVVPCLISEDEKQYICNNKTNEFEKTDGTGYRDWFNDKNGFTHGNLKRVTRLLKYLRDHKGNFSVKSVLLTTLIGNTVIDGNDGSEFESIPDALKTVSDRINDFLQSNLTMPRISNPVLPEEDFTRHWDQRKYENFRKLFNVYNEKINAAYIEVEHDESIDKWRDVFGDGFGRKKGNGKDAGSKSFATVIPRKQHAQ